MGLQNSFRATMLLMPNSQSLRDTPGNMGQDIGKERQKAFSLFQLGCDHSITVLLQLGKLSCDFNQLPLSRRLL